MIWFCWFKIRPAAKTSTEWVEIYNITHNCLKECTASTIVTESNVKMSPMIYKVVNLARSGSVPLKKELVPVLISPVIINPILCQNFKQTVINTVQLYLPYVLGIILTAW